MISIQEAMERIWARLPEKKKETLDISESTGRVLAHQVTAAESSPRFTNSAMDGMAVRFEDLQSLPVELSIVGESRAGVPFQGIVQNGQAVRISTGAVLPQGADTVIPIEDCQVEQSRVKVLTAKKKGANVRKKGEEFESGEVLLAAGTTLFPEHLALLAAQGIQRVEVYARPRVVLLTTGSEVKSFKEEIADYEIRDSNLLMLGEAIKLAGGALVVSDRLPDDFSLTVQKLKEAQNKADVIVLSGGVSVGPHDHVKKAAAEAGISEVFWKVNQQPGKPLFFAAKDNTLLFGLPGNPVSAFMSMAHYVYPVLRRLQGFDDDRAVCVARARSRLEINKKRAQLLRVRLEKTDEGWHFIPLKRQGSHMITSISQADGYIIVGPVETIEKDETRNVYLFPWRRSHGLC